MIVGAGRQTPQESGEEVGCQNAGLAGRGGLPGVRGGGGGGGGGCKAAGNTAHCCCNASGQYGKDLKAKEPPPQKEGLEALSTCTHSVHAHEQVDLLTITFHAQQWILSLVHTFFAVSAQPSLTLTHTSE